MRVFIPLVYAHLRNLAHRKLEFTPVNQFDANYVASIVIPDEGRKMSLSPQTAPGPQIVIYLLNYPPSQYTEMVFVMVQPCLSFCRIFICCLLLFFICEHCINSSLLM